MTRLSTAEHFTPPLITANVSGMQKAKVTVYLSEPVVASVEEVMRAEDRTFSNVVERVLKAALGAGLGVPGVGQRPTETGPLEPPSPAPGADEIAAGTNGNRSAAKGEGKQRTTKAKKQVASLGSATAGNPAPSPTMTGRAHSKPHMPAIQCPSREFVDGRCVKCGALAR